MLNKIFRNQTGIKYLIAIVVAISSLMFVQTSMAGHVKPGSEQQTSGLKMDAPTAFARAESGELVLLDIRSPEEWQETGVGSVAKKVSMHQPGFLEKLNALIEDDKSKPIALICAVGGRSNWLQGELVKRGYTNVIDVAEGMLGSPAGPGWLKRGLPIVK